MLIAVTVLLAFMSGVIVAALALAMSGGGHGWTSAFISASAVLTAPFAAVAWIFRRARLGVWLSAAVTVIHSTILLLLIRETQAEGSNYLFEVWRLASVYVAIWALLWFGWQAVGLAALFVAIRHRVRAA